MLQNHLTPALEFMGGSGRINAQLDAAIEQFRQATGGGDPLVVLRQSEYDALVAALRELSKQRPLVVTTATNETLDRVLK